MENLVVQGIVLVVIIGLGYYLFKLDHLKVSVKSLVLVGLFVVIATVLSIFVSIRLPLFGVDSLRIGFAQIVLVIGGALVSPSYAFLMGLIYDLLGLILMPTTPFLGFTLNSILACVLPSLWMNKQFKLNSKSLVVILLGLGLFFEAAIFFTDSIKIGDHLVKLEGLTRVGMMGFCLVMCALLIGFVFWLPKKVSMEDQQKVVQWMGIVILIEVLIQFISTPFWLQLMWGIPFAASLLIRVLKACVMIPLNTIIAFFTMKTLQRLK